MRIFKNCYNIVHDADVSQPAAAGECFANIAQAAIPRKSARENWTGPTTEISKREELEEAYNNTQIDLAGNERARGPRRREAAGHCTPITVRCSAEFVAA